MLEKPYKTKLESMQNSRDIYIHVGLPKTGTTFLQNHVFPKISDIEVITPNKIGMRNYLLGINMQQQKPLLISDEHLSTHFYVGTKGLRYTSRYDIAKRIKKLFPTANIIVVFRNKKKWIKSFYAQYISSIYRKNISFEKFQRIALEQGLLDFEDYEKFLRDTFNNVLVLNHFELIEDPKKFVRKICDFIGTKSPEFDVVKSNVGLNNKQLSFIKWVKNWNISNRYKEKIVELFLFVTRGQP